MTERASRAAVTQRAGRAARQASGIAIRLWEEGATASLPEHDPPEILEADLSALLLTSLLWGESDPRRLPFLDAPPAAALDEARERLSRIGALDGDGRITAHGRAVARLPVEPRLAHMLIEADRRGFGTAAAHAAALLTERGLGGNDPDLEVRHRRWVNDRSARAEAARRMAGRWNEIPRSSRAKSRDAAERVSTSLRTNEILGASIALAFPDRLSRRRDPSGETWQSVGGRGFRLDPASPLARSQWLAVAEVAGHAAGARILSAAAIDEQEVLALFADRVETRHEGDFDPATGSVTPTRSRRLGAIRLSSGPDPRPDTAIIESALLDGVRTHGLDLIGWSGGALHLRQRAAFARGIDGSVPVLDDAALIARLDEWLPPLLSGKRRLADVDAQALYGALQGLLGYEALRRIDQLAPASFTSPAASTHAIDYAAPAGPSVEVRAQALFGLGAHPMVGDGRVPLTLLITSPAGRPIQTTRDLPQFWSGSWREVAKEMRGRYPKHPWPDDPAAASATLRTKRADARNQ